MEKIPAATKATRWARVSEEFLDAARLIVTRRPKRTAEAIAGLAQVAFEAGLEQGYELALAARKEESRAD